MRAERQANPYFVRPFRDGICDEAIDAEGRQPVVRAFYECAVFESLREGLKTKGIWVTGADKWRNPDEDLPPDFAQRRAENYAALGKPLDPAQFIELFKAELSTELAALNAADRDAFVAAARRAVMAEKIRADQPARFSVAMVAPAAAGVSGQIFGASGENIILYSQPRPIETCSKPEGEGFPGVTIEDLLRCLVAFDDTAVLADDHHALGHGCDHGTVARLGLTQTGL